MAKNKFLDLIVGYESHADSDTKGKKFTVMEIAGSVSSASNSRTARAITRFTTSVADILTYTSTRMYGMFLLGFGLLTLLLHFIKDYLNFYAEVPLSVLIVGAVFALISIPLLVVDKPLGIAMQDFPLTAFIFFEFFCIKPAHRRKYDVTIPNLVGLILGLLCAILGAFIPVLYVAGAILSLVYLYLAFLSPEFSFLLTFLLMPYLPIIPVYGDIILSVFVGVTIISFARKVMAGKRIYFLEQYDIVLFLMLLFVLISGIFVKGIESFTSSLVMIILSLGYVLTGSLVTNRRLADCVIKALIVSSIPISGIAIAEFVVIWLSSGLDGFGGVRATFETPEVLAIFLLVSAVCSLYFVFARRHKGTKVLYAAIFVLMLLAMALTLRGWVFVAGALGVLAYMSLNFERGAGIALGTITLLPYAVLFLPDDWLMTLSEVSVLYELGLGECAAVWVRSRRMLLDNIFSGVGIGAESFSSEYANYSADAVATNSQSFLLQIACEAGIFALVAFMTIFIIRLKHRSIYVPYVKNSQVSLLTKFSEVAIVVLMVYGLFTSLWSDMTMYYLFWCVFGLGSSVLRISKQEFDDRVAYFSDGSGADASSIDIEIK